MPDQNFALLTWNANTEPDIAGYKIYYSQQPTIQLSVIDVGNVTSVGIGAQFTNDGLWYFALQAYDTSGNGSALTSFGTKRIIRIPGTLQRRK